jgi:hypothetical protein
MFNYAAFSVIQLVILLVTVVSARVIGSLVFPNRVADLRAGDIAGDNGAGFDVFTMGNLDYKLARGTDVLFLKSAAH